MKNNKKYFEWRYWCLSNTSFSFSFSLSLLPFLEILAKKLFLPDDCCIWPWPLVIKEVEAGRAGSESGSNLDGELAATLDEVEHFPPWGSSLPSLGEESFWLTCLCTSPVVPGLSWLGLLLLPFSSVALASKVIPVWPWWVTWACGAAPCVDLDRAARWRLFSIALLCGTAEKGLEDTDERLVGFWRTLWWLEG